MSSIIKRDYIKQGSIINLQERMQFTYANEPENTKAQPGMGIQEKEIDLESETKHEKLYEQAIKQKEEILIAAKQEADEIRAKAYEEIRITREEEIEKIQQRIQETKERVESMIQTAKVEEAQIIQAAYSQKQKILEQATPEVVEVIKMLVTHILYEEVVKGNQWISYVVKKMIFKEKLLGDLVVHLSPDVLASITTEEYKEFENLKNKITLEADESLNNTTCMVETTEGSILYDLSEGIDKIIKELTILEKLTIEAVYD